MKISCTRLTTLALGAGLALAWPTLGQDDGTAERVFSQAQRLEREEKVDDARKEYDLLVTRFPQTVYAQQALLALAWSYRSTGETQLAHESLDKLAQTYPDSPSAAAAWVMKGRFQVEDAANRDELDEARTPFRRAESLFGPKEYPGLAARVEARVRRGQVHLLLGEPDQAGLDFLGAIEEEDRSSWVPQAQYGLARALLDRGEWVGSANALETVLQDPDTGSDLKSEATIDLGFVHRHFVRPSLGQARWLASRPLKISGTTLKRPLRVAARRDGSLLVLDAGQDVVLIVAPDGSVAAKSSQPQAGDVWWSADGNPFATVGDALVGLQGGGRQTFSPAGIPIKNLVAGQLGVFRQWFALDKEKKTLWSFDRRGQGKMLSSQAQDVEDMALAPRGGLLLLDRRQGSVTRLDMDGSAAKRVSGSWKKPQSVASDTLGNLYVLDAGQNVVDVRDPDGAKIATLGPRLPGGVELKSPEDIAVDGQGRIYIADRGLAQVYVVE